MAMVFDSSVARFDYVTKVLTRIYQVSRKKSDRLSKMDYWLNYLDNAVRNVFTHTYLYFLSNRLTSFASEKAVKSMAYGSFTIRRQLLIAEEKEHLERRF